MGSYRCVPIVALGVLWVCSACRVTGEDIEYWKGTVKGPGKIVAVAMADKYDMDLRTKAALALVEMERQDVDGVAELQRLVQQLDDETRREIVSGIAPGLRELMQAAPPQQEDDAVQGPAPSQVRAKDAAFLMITHADRDTRKELTQAVVSWYVEDFNGRNLAGNFSAEQVVRSLGAPAAQMLVDALDEKLPQAALVKLAELIGQLGDRKTKQRAAKRLVDIERTMESAEFTSWLTSEIQQQLKRTGSKLSDDKVERMAELNRERFILEGALPAMKHLAGEDVVAERLVELASAEQTDPVTTGRRVRALQALEGKVGREHLDQLLSLALDEDNPVRVRDYAFDRIGDIRSDDAIEPMWPLVRSAKDQRLRWRAGELVLAIGGPGILQEFFAKLPSGRRIQYEPEELEGYAARMGQMNPLPRSFARQQLRSNDWFDRVIAIKFFERKGSSQDVALLQPLTQDTTQVHGKGWPEGASVGKVAEAAMAALRERIDGASEAEDSPASE